MASTKEIRLGLKAALEAAFPEGYQISAYALSSPSPPAFEVVPGRIGYHQTFGDDGGGLRAWSVVAYFSLTADVASQQRADAFFENDPVKAALEADPTLGGVVDDLIVDDGEPVFLTVKGLQSPAVGGRWNLRILT